MSRKKWTSADSADDNLLLIREKRKWQIALRRYVLEQHKSLAYAPFFALDHTRFREWIALQFDETLTWANFSSHWQFDHVLPVAYFDFSDEDDLKLCWNFTNIRVVKTDKTTDDDLHIDLLAAKEYFSSLYKHTNYPVCAGIVEKIAKIESSQKNAYNKVASFFIANQNFLLEARAFTADDFERLNTGTDLPVLLAEKEFLKKFGS